MGCPTKMSEIVKFLETLSGTLLPDEDGDMLSIKKAKGVPILEIQKFEGLHNLLLPETLKDLLLYSNGIKIYGIEIFPLEQMEFFEENMLLSFHPWGNGDFDCISTNPSYHYGEVYFMNHSITNITLMNISFFDWIIRCVEEIRAKKTLLHPDDYRYRKEDGMYKKVFMGNDLK
jgi:hypothetical protein